MIWGDPSYGLAIAGALSGALLTVSLVAYLVGLVKRLMS